MEITLPDSLASFIDEQVRLGRYPSADASGDHEEADTVDFDEMEREALAILPQNS